MKLRVIQKTCIYVYVCKYAYMYTLDICIHERKASWKGIIEEKRNNKIQDGGFL